MPDASDTHPLNAVTDELIRVEWCLSTGDHATAHTGLARALAILDNCEFPHYQRTADRLSHEL